MPDPNREQRYLINNTEGVYLVDAGPGTGKTFTITRRYAEIIDKETVEPRDVLLVTFTKSAATEMKERIVQHSDYSINELADAPIQTFHSRCHDLLQQHGYKAPCYLGIDDRITNATTVVEDELVEEELFREFYREFQDRHPEYSEFYRVTDEASNLLDLIKELAAKGVFPEKNGWYRGGESKLDGGYGEFKRYFDRVNEPREGVRGLKQSELRDSLSRFGRDKTYLPSAPSKKELRGGRGSKQVDERMAERIFGEDRRLLKRFIHDLYFEYFEYSLSRNYLNFGFLQLLAFVLLCEDDELRRKQGFEYVMVDEFQDTSEIQFKLALLMSASSNFCVVGDWKQSIYSFQYADVDNIREFKTRLDRYKSELNQDRKRVEIDAGDVMDLELQINYRSTREIIDFSEETLVTPATRSEDVDRSILDDVVELEPDTEFEGTRIEAVTSSEEHEAVLEKIQEIVGNSEYMVYDVDGEGNLVTRTPGYSDVAVLTRTRDYGRDLIDVAEDYGFPMSYDGGVELFRTDAAKLLLAWLRILEYNGEKGWAVVLEEVGYTLDEVQDMLGSGEFPDNLVRFKHELDRLESVGGVARQVFDKYGLQGGYSDSILNLVQQLHDSSTLTRGDLVRFIERGIEGGATHEVSAGEDVESVSVQTIHSVKGLEYPVVILANMNEGKFPPRSGGRDTIFYSECMGLRHRKVYSEVGEYPHIFDNWKYDVYRNCLPDNYSEERRLLYVAVTRAESHVCFVGGDEPNTFLKELPVEVMETEGEVDRVDVESMRQSQLPFTVSPPEGPQGFSPHQLMSDVFEGGLEVDEGDFEVDGYGDGGVEGSGKEFGSRVHEFAEKYALGRDVEVSSPDEDRVQRFIDELEGELYVEENVVLPLEVDGDRVVVSGIADLVQVDSKSGVVKVVDYKTDRSKEAVEEYRKQVSVYHHVLESCYPEYDVETQLYYTHFDERVEVDPVSRGELRELVRDQ